MEIKDGKLALDLFCKAANAVFSDADHMRNDVPRDEALAYFKRNREIIDEQLRRLRANFHHLEELSKGEI